MCICFFSAAVVNGQQVAATSGNYFQNNSGSIAYTIGEPIIAIYNQKGTVLTQGFQQPILSVSIQVDELSGWGSSISAFPNPAISKLTLKVPDIKLLYLKYVLIDMNGTVFMQKKIESTETEIPVNSLRSGAYLIKVYVGTKQVKTLKIIKL
ncbi:MAG: T9SS type A sorting domain-containing protein [Bacteroidota bacterium]|nr:T9SS type A sorting domain-containing protein [Bacteroidota bacterium]